MDIHEQIGARVRALRERLGLTQDEISQRSGLGTETVSRIERGVQGVTIGNLNDLAPALGVELRDLCDVTSPPGDGMRDAEISEIIKMLDDAPSEAVSLSRLLVSQVMEFYKRPD